MPLVGENRILAYFGLKYLNREPSKGLLSIIKICGLDKHNITIDDIVFKIGPRINAAGRMRMDENDENASPSGGHAAVELLIEGNESDRRGVRQRHRRLQPGPQVDRPLRHAGSARLHRAQPRNEGTEEHRDLQSHAG